MRGTALFLSALAMVMLAGNVHAQSSTLRLEATEKGSRPVDHVLQKRITVDMENAVLRDVLAAIDRQAGGLRLSYSPTAIPLQQRVSLHVKNVSAIEALETALRGTGIRITRGPEGQVLLLSPTKADTTKAATGTIRGRVVDSANKRGLQGVMVTIPARRITTTTGDGGAFTFTNLVPGEYRVTFKLLGYQSTTQVVVVEEGRGASMRVALSEAASMLSEVVTSVTGTQRKLEVGNDITVIDVEKVMREAPISTVTDLLETRVPGLTVMRSSGVPGAPARYRLRGAGGGLLSTQEGAPTNDPIVIVDGIRINASQSGVSDQNLTLDRGRTRNYDASVDYDGRYYPPLSGIDQIDPNSIEKIEVLKGPSASALYGSDAANGVIVITTKRGKAGPTRWSATGATSLQYLAGSYTAPGYYPYCFNFSLGTSALCGTGGTATGAFNTRIIDSIVRFQALDIDRLKPFGTGNRNELSGMVSGGTQTLTYSMTGSASNELGYLKVPEIYQDLFRTAFDSSMPAEMRRPNRLDQRSGIAGITMEPRQGIRVAVTTRVTYSSKLQSAAQRRLASLASTYIDTANLLTSALQLYAEQTTSTGLVADNTVAVNWDAWHVFPLTATVGFSRDTRDDVRFLTRGVATQGVDSLGRYSSGTQNTNTGNARLNGTLFPGRRVSVALGTDGMNLSRRQVQMRTDSLDRGVTTPTRIDYAQRSSYHASTGGWFAEPRLNLNSRFFVNPGFRLDGNSLSGSHSGVNGGLWSLFPKLNFSWVALDAQESTPYWGFLSLLRPRLSLGVAGVQPAPGWQLRLMQTTGSRDFADGGLELSTLGNTQLRPERTREIEGGFDADLWGGRVTLTITQFVKVRTDAIEKLSVAGSVYGGSLQQYTNIGRVRNTGTELTVNATVVETERIRWAVGMSLSKYTNTLVSLNSERSYIDMGRGTRLVEGYPLFGRWERPILGWRTPSLGERLATTDVIVGDSAVYMGQQSPNFELPINTQLSLFRGQVSVNATFQYKDGLTQFSSGSEPLLANVYLNPNATLAEQAAALAAGTSNSQYQTNYGLIQTVNLMRFTSLSVGYNVPRSFTQRLGIPSMSLALQGRNLGVWSSYRGYDPDVNAQTVGDITEDTGVLPSPRTWRLQVRLGN